MKLSRVLTALTVLRSNRVYGECLGFVMGSFYAAMMIQSTYVVLLNEAIKAPN